MFSPTKSQNIELLPRQLISLNDEIRRPFISYDVDLAYNNYTAEKYNILMEINDINTVCEKTFYIRQLFAGESKKNLDPTEQSFL